MSQEKPVPTRFIGLDVHKHYLVAIGVDTELNQVLGPQRVPLVHLQLDVQGPHPSGCSGSGDDHQRLPTVR